MLKNEIDLPDEMATKFELSQDHVDPDYITWREFIEWFQREGEARDQVHNAQMYQIGLTRLEIG